MMAQKCKGAFPFFLAFVCSFCCAEEGMAGLNTRLSGNLKGCFTVGSTSLHGSIPLLEVGLDLKRSRTSCKCSSGFAALTVYAPKYQEQSFFGIISLVDSRKILVPLSADSGLLRSESSLLIDASCALQELKHGQA